MVETKRWGIQAASSVIDTGISNFFRWQGRVVARHPFATIVLTLVIAGSLSGYGIGVKYYEEINPSALYAAKDAPSVPDQDYVELVHGFQPLEERLVVSSKKGSETNLLANPEESLWELMAIWKKINSITYNGHTGFQDVCDRGSPGYPCKVSSILQFWDLNDTKLLNDPDPIGTISQGNPPNGYGGEIPIEFVLGGIQRDSTGRIISANAFQNELNLDLALDSDEKALFDALRESGKFAKHEKDLKNIDDLLKRGFDPRPIVYSRVLASAMRDWGSQKNATLNAIMTHIFLVQEESDKAIRQDMWWILLTTLLVGIYSHSVLFRNNWALTKLHLVGLSFFAIAMAVGSSFGLALTLGVPFNLIVATVPFLLLGLGIDDTFIILGQFRRTDRRLPPEERISIAVSRAGASIFVTSLTDLIAFMLALTSSVPAVQQFGVYASFGVLFDFFFQVTTFVAFAALEAKREYRMLNGHGMLGLGPLPPLESTDTRNTASVKRVERPAASTEESMRTEDQCRSPSGGGTGLNSKKSETPPVERRPIFGKRPFDPDGDSFATRLFGKWIPSITLTRWGSTAAIFIEIVALAAAVYGCMHVNVDWQFREWFAPKGWLHDGFNLELTYFQGEQMMLDVYTKEGSYFYNQQEMLNCVEAFRESELISSVPKVDSWFEDYYKWSQVAHENEVTKDGFAQTSSQFVEWVLEYLDSEDGAYHSQHVIFNLNKTKIVSTNFARGYTVDITSGVFAVKIMKDLREVVRENLIELSPIVYNPMFVFYDGLRIIEYETVRNVVIVSAAVFVVVTLTLANVLAAFIVVLMIILTDIMLFGYMWYVGLTFNMVTSISIVLAVGVAVDYAVHIAHNFLVQKGTKKERAALALQAIGGEVFCAAFTSFIAVIGLAFTKHYIMQVFFKMFSVIIVFGAWHGIVILPMIMSFVGPPSYSDAHGH